jgi:glycosyltransferase involved in cell wall biosynthesis
VPARVLDIELTEEIRPIWGVEKYDYLWILVRYKTRPLGWIAVSKDRSQPVVSGDAVRQAIVNQAGAALSLGFLSDRLKRNVQPVANSDPVSVVVCTRDRADLLFGCLQALLALDYPDYEIIVVDNASSSTDTSELAARLKVRHVREERPGLDWARNRGIAEARHDLVALTDDDARPDRYWLRAIASGFGDPEVMAVTGLVAPAELETPTQELYEFRYGGMGKGFQRRIFRRDDISIRELVWAHVFGVGANMAFRRRVFDAIGVFDVALDVGTSSRSGGDLDVLHRLVADGYTLLYEPSALVWHIHRRSESVLRKQLFDNSAGFGSYLLTCRRNHTVSSSTLLDFALRDWLGWWLLRRLLRPRGFPRRLVLAEILGAFCSPFAYLAAQAQARRTATRFKAVPIKDDKGAVGSADYVR